jgi:ubiquinone/menaquinone biosynthesis C-methylase UbiE
MKLYSELAEYYFAIEKNHRTINDDIAFIRSIIGPDRPVSLLDLGCGTGEHLGALSTSGISCTGIDTSAAMLSVARRRFSAGITFIQGDMKDFDCYEEFHVIMSLFGSLNYLVENADLESALWNIWRAMKPGGRGILEVWHSLPLEKIRRKELAPVSRTRYEGVEIDRMRGFALIPLQGRTIAEVSYAYEITSGGQKKTLRDRHIMRTFSKQEITDCLTENGFSVKELYSSFRKEPFNDNSIRMVIVFSKD